MTMRKFYTLLVVALFAVNGVMAQTTLSGDGKTLTIDLTTGTDLSARLTADGAEFTGTVTKETLRGIAGIKVNAEIDGLGTIDETLVTKVILQGTAPYTYFDLRSIALSFINMAEIDMSNSVLHDLAFTSLSWLTSPTAGYAFKSDVNSKGIFQASKLKKITLPQSTPNVKGFGMNALASASTLQYINIPEGIETIAETAFAYFGTYTFRASETELGTLRFPSTLKFIGKGAFNGSIGGIKTIYFPKSLTTMSSTSFTSWTAGAKDFYFEGDTPPTFASDAFTGSYTMTFHVSKATGVKALYEAAISTNGAKARITVVADIEEGGTSINEGEAEAVSVSVYPNPTVDVVTVNGLDGALKQVYDTAGRLILQTEENSFDLSGQAQGVYFIKAGNQALKVIKK